MNRVKKIGLAILSGLVLLLLLAVLGVRFFLDGAIKRSVETVGPMLTKAEVKLDGVSVSLLTGSGRIKGLFVGNPQGFKSPSAILVGAARLDLEPASLLSDKVIVKSIIVQAPEITFETDLRSVNLKQILANVEAATGGGKEPPATQAKPGKTLQVNDFRITGGRVHVSLTALGGRSATVALPEIHLADLGQGPDGITPAELTAKVLRVLLDASIQAGSAALHDLTKGLGKDAADNAGKAVEGLGGLDGLLKRKQK